MIWPSIFLVLIAMIRNHREALASPPRAATLAYCAFMDHKTKAPVGPRFNVGVAWCSTGNVVGSLLPPRKIIDGGGKREIRLAVVKFRLLRSVSWQLVAELILQRIESFL
jgi:hypothetical protein